jgi:O-antigen ligase
VSLVFGCAVFFAVARWSRLISQRVFRWSVFLFALGAALAAPVLINFLLSRPETFSYRLGLLQTAFDTFLQRPISGAGLNNSSAVMEGSHVSVEGGRRVQLRVVHNYYLIMLIEVGLVGVFLYFSFFAQAVISAFRSMRAADTEMKLILVGVVASLASIAVANLAEPFGGHAIHAMLWLYAALSIALARSVHTTDRIAATAHASTRTT